MQHTEFSWVTIVWIVSSAMRLTAAPTSQEICCVPVSVNLLKPGGYFTYHQVQHSKILHGARTAFKCSVWTCSLHNINRYVLYNRSGECLLRGMH
jgi:hypothetical protein